MEREHRIVAIMEEDTEQPTILIVEDERPLADLYADFLKSYTVHTTYSGEEALEVISDAVDVVLLDRRMPGLPGEEVLKAIREAEYDCRVAMITAVSPDVDILDMGFDEYVSKPIDMGDLIEVVERLLELNNYDELVGEYYQLVSKKAALEAEERNIDIAEHEEFRRLTDRVDEIEEKLQAGEGTRFQTDIRSLLR